MIDVRNVSKSYGGQQVLDDVTCMIPRGGITSIIGPNGAGKSTLFNIVSGFLRAEAGTVSLEGRRIDRLPPHRIARAGLVRTFQTARALARMTVLDNVVLAAPRQPGERLVRNVVGGRAARRREQEVRVRAHELLELVRLDGHAHALAATLSGGQRKLLDFARVLMTEPRLVLLDEPMAGVNPVLRGELLEHVVSLREEHGVTVLLVEHDLEVVMDVSDRVVVMSNGAVIASGPPDGVRSDARVVDAYLGVEE